MKTKVSIGFLVFILIYGSVLADSAPTDQSTLKLIEPENMKQIGIVVEQRSTYIDQFVFFNQIFKNKIFYELRAYYIHHYITSDPPANAQPQPSVSDEKNVNGTGVGAILGRDFNLTPTVLLMPFIKTQYLTNTAVAYEDSLGNKLTSKNSSAYLGARLLITVTDSFNPYVQYYAGYERSDLDGSGYYGGTDGAAINSLVSTVEFGFPYRINKEWSVMPYLQLVTTANNPNTAALKQPIAANALTTTIPVFALRVTYSF